MGVGAWLDMHKRGDGCIRCRICQKHLLRLHCQCEATTKDLRANRPGLPKGDVSTPEVGAAGGGGGGGGGASLQRLYGPQSQKNPCKTCEYCVSRQAGLLLQSGPLLEQCQAKTAEAMTGNKKPLSF